MVNFLLVLGSSPSLRTFYNPRIPRGVAGFLLSKAHQKAKLGRGAEGRSATEDKREEVQLSSSCWNKSRPRVSYLQESQDIMNFKTIATLGFGALLAMTGIHTLAAEKLVTEDGKVAAKKLKLDAEFADKKYESATFGMG